MPIRGAALYSTFAVVCIVVLVADAGPVFVSSSVVVNDASNYKCGCLHNALDRFYVANFNNGDVDPSFYLAYNTSGGWSRVDLNSTLSPKQIRQCIYCGASDRLFFIPEGYSDTWVYVDSTGALQSFSLTSTTAVSVAVETPGGMMLVDANPDAATLYFLNTTATPPFLEVRSDTFAFEGRLTGALHEADNHRIVFWSHTTPRAHIYDLLTDTVASMELQGHFPEQSGIACVLGKDSTLFFVLNNVSDNIFFVVEEGESPYMYDPSGFDRDYHIHDCIDAGSWHGLVGAASYDETDVSMALGLTIDANGLHFPGGWYTAPQATLFLGMDHLRSKAFFFNNTSVASFSPCGDGHYFHHDGSGDYSCVPCRYSRCEGGTLTICGSEDNSCNCPDGRFPSGDTCTACGCDALGALSASCDISGVCYCAANFSGSKCSDCANTFYRDGATCLACPCVIPNVKSCGILVSDGPVVCECIRHVTGERCDVCPEDAVQDPETGACVCRPEDYNACLYDPSCNPGIACYVRPTAVVTSPLKRSGVLPDVAVTIGLETQIPDNSNYQLDNALDLFDHDANVSLSVTFTASPDHQSVFIEHAPLASGHTFSLMVNPKAIVLGNSNRPYFFGNVDGYNFTTLANILLVLPADGAVDVSLDQQIVAVFKQPVSLRSFFVNAFIGKARVRVLNVSLDASLSATGVVLEATSQFPFVDSSSYEAQLTVAYEDAESVLLTEEVTWTFSTVTIFPTVAFTVPSTDDADAVSRTSPLNVSFDKVMNVSALDSVSLFLGDVVVSASTEWCDGSLSRDSGTCVGLIPDGALKFKLEYTLHVSTVAADTLGNHLEAPYSFAFTTAGCGDNSYASAGSCLCLSGTYTLNGEASAPDGSECTEPCPPNAECYGDLYPPVPAPGFAPTDDPLVFVECFPKEACLGGLDGACKDGYSGPACSQCFDGFYRLENRCAKCPPAHSLILTLFVFLFVGVCIGILVSATWVAPDVGPDLDAAASGSPITPMRARLAALSIVVSYLQVVALFASFDLQWAPQVDALFSVFSFFNLNVDLMAHECAIPTPWATKHVLTSAAPLMFGAVAAAWTAATTALANAKGAPPHAAVAPPSVGTIVCAFTSFFTLAYTALSATALEAFDCTPLPTGQARFDPDPSRYCYEKWWWSLFPYLLLVLLLYPIGIVLGFGALLYRSRAAAGMPGSPALRVVSSLVYKYRPEMFMWEEVVLMRKLAVVVARVMFTSLPAVQAFIAFISLGVSLMAQSRFAPYASAALNQLEATLLASACAILLCGLVGRSEEFAGTDRGTNWGWVAVLLAVASLIVAAVLLVAIFIPTKKDRTSKYVDDSDLDSASMVDMAPYENSHPPPQKPPPSKADEAAMP